MAKARNPQRNRPVDSEAARRGARRDPRAHPSRARRARCALHPADLALQRTAEVSGRGLLFAGFLPPAWAAGVAMLSLSKVLENMELGYNVLHGQYDWMRDPALSSTRYEWDWACPAADWRRSHNFVHHTFTNIIGKDRDVGYGLLRMADEQPWHPARLGNPLYAFVQMLMFEWAVAVHDLELDHVLAGEKTLRQLWDQSSPMRAKALRQLGKDFVLFPLLAGPAAPFVFTGNLSANLIRNVWAFLVIFCGHFPEGVQVFPADRGSRDRGRVVHSPDPRLGQRRRSDRALSRGDGTLWRLFAAIAS